MNAPYRSKIETLGPLAVWEVDGAAVRRDIAPDFTNFGQHYRIPQIPEYELWLDVELTEDERPFFVANDLEQWKLMRRGVSYEQALEAADRKEQRMRAHAGDVPRPTPIYLSNPNVVRETLVSTASDGLEIWRVNGNMVRSLFDDNYTEGGHDLVDSYIPHGDCGQVWLDNDNTLGDDGFILLHELVEYRHMQQGMGYDGAHSLALKAEWQARQQPASLPDALAHEGYQNGAV